VSPPQNHISWPNCEVNYGVCSTSGEICRFARLLDEVPFTIPSQLRGEIAACPGPIGVKGV